MMYKIEGEDLYLIGTSEHSMIGKFIDQIIPEEELPKTLTSFLRASVKRKVLMDLRREVFTVSISSRNRR